MYLKKTIGILTMAFAIHFSSFAQSSDIHLDKLTLDKKEKKTFNTKDSSITVYIDTLVMKDKSSLQFYGKNDVKLIVKHAEIGENVYIAGEAGKNNASNFDIDINFQKLGSLYINARGKDAMNGTKTYPNGNAGDVTLVYNADGIKPQTEDKKQDNYIKVDVNPGGLHVTPSSEIPLIYSQIKRAPNGLRGLPQGQIYSGSTGKEGKVTIKANNE